MILKLKVFCFVILGITLFISGCMQSNGNKITKDNLPQREDMVLIINSNEKESKNWKVTMSLVEHNELGIGYRYEALYKGVETIEDVSVNILGSKGSTNKLSTGQALGGTTYSIKNHPTEVEISIKWGKNMNEAIIFELIQ